MLATVQVVAPAPGTAPKKPARTLPSPAPISSWLGLWSSPVIESPTKAVSRLLIDAIKAMVKAGKAESASSPKEKEGRTISNNPVGTSPITGASVNTVTPKMVPTSRATIEAGRIVCNRLGHRALIPIANPPRISALRLMLVRALGHWRSADKGPPRACGAPNRGRVLTKSIIPPTPVVKPAITGYGV